MMYFDDATIDGWINEDAPYLDLTTHVLGIGAEVGRLTFLSRSAITVCATEEASRVLAKLGCTVEHAVASGEKIAARQLLLSAVGRADALHLAWKTCVNLLEYASGIATRTAALLAAARAVAPRIEVVATRKGFPGTRALATKAVLAGGGMPHRLGLSETVLVFAQHRVFLRSADELGARLREWKARAPEKKILIEAAGASDALAAVRAGADGIQFDKVPPEDLAGMVAALRAEREGLVLIAAGGVTGANAAAYAATGVDVLATSSLYHGTPADIAAKMEPVS